MRAHFKVGVASFILLPVACGRVESTSGAKGAAGSVSDSSGRAGASPSGGSSSGGAAGAAGNENTGGSSTTTPSSGKCDLQQKGLLPVPRVGFNDPLTTETAVVSQVTPTQIT